MSIALQTATIKVPVHIRLHTSPDVKVQKKSKQEYRLYFTKSTVFPVKIDVVDPFGVKVRYYIKDPSEIKDIIIEPEIVLNPEPNPVTTYRVPKLCPRISPLNNQDNSPFVYDATLDLMNERPNLQLFDPDARTDKKQRELLNMFDQENVLRVTRVRVSYDYEDDTIVDYQGPHPLTGKPHLVYEGKGGFYANFHYAVMPFDERYLKLSRQELLHLAEGKLHEIDREDLKPLLRTHSFLPGPYQSKESIYPLCEWGDTSFQATRQELLYQHLKIWDWDLPAGGDHLLLVVWEGDEESWLVSDGLLDPFYLTDDVVGVFEIRRQGTQRPLVLRNDSGSFEIELETVAKDR